MYRTGIEFESISLTLPRLQKCHGGGGSQEWRTKMSRVMYKTDSDFESISLTLFYFLHVGPSRQKYVHILY